MGRLNSNRRDRGGALLTALAFVLVISVVVTAIANLSTQHYARTSLEMDNSNALLLADAALNHELNYISINQLNDPPAHYAFNNTQLNGSIAGVPGTYRVWVTNDPDDGTAWIPPNNMIIHAVGMVGGITRKVIARGRRQSIFDAFATFGIEEVDFNGSGSVVNGDIGTNNEMSVVNPITNVPDPWTINLMGGDATINTEGVNVVRAPNPLEFPTIDEIIVRTPPVGFGNSGWAWLTNNTGGGLPLNRSNGAIRTFAATGAALTSAGTELVSALPTTGNPPNWNSTKVTIDSADIGKLRAGTVYVGGNGALVQSGGTAVTGKKAMILTTTYQVADAQGVMRWYGDYFFSDINTGGATDNCIIIDNGGWTNGQPGTIRIWMDHRNPDGSLKNGNDSADAININVYFTSADAATFRLYYNKCATIQVGGNSTYWGGFYGVSGRTCPNNSPTTISVAGGSTVNGSVLSDVILVQGGSTINFPANIDNPADFSLWFGFKDQWKEVLAPNMGTVFPDGTNR